MPEKTVQQRIADLEAEIVRLEGGQDALLYCLAKIVQKATANMDMKDAAELIDSFRVNVPLAEVASWPARKRKAYEHTVKASEMIAAQFLMVLQGREEELAEVLNPWPKGVN